MQRFRKKETGTRLEDQLASLSVPFAHNPSEAGEHIPVSLQGRSLAHGHSIAELAQSHVRFLKFHSEDTI